MPVKPTKDFAFFKVDTLVDNSITDFDLFLSIEDHFILYSGNGYKWSRDELTELLKQPQYKPFAVEEQVAVIFAGTRGYLDPLPVSAVGRFEQSLLTELRVEKSILDGIAAEKALSADNEKKLVAFLDKFAKGFAA